MGLLISCFGIIYLIFGYICISLGLIGYEIHHLSVYFQLMICVALLESNVFVLELLTEGYGKLFLSIIEMGCYYISQ